MQNLIWFGIFEYNLKYQNEHWAGTTTVHWPSCLLCWLYFVELWVRLVSVPFCFSPLPALRPSELAPRQWYVLTLNATPRLFCCWDSAQGQMRNMTFTSFLSHVRTHHWAALKEKAPCTVCMDLLNEQVKVHFLICPLSAHRIAPMIWFAFSWGQCTVHTVFLFDHLSVIYVHFH